MTSRAKLSLLRLRPLAFTALFALLAVLALLGRDQPNLASDDFQKYNGRCIRPRMELVSPNQVPQTAHF